MQCREKIIKRVVNESKAAQQQQLVAMGCTKQASLLFASERGERVRELLESRGSLMVVIRV